MNETNEFVEFVKNVGDLENVDYPDEVLYYFNTRITESDLYYLLLIQHQKVSNSLGLFMDFLKDNEDELLYNKRNQFTSLIRLDAMGLIERRKKGRAVYYYLTDNGLKLRKLRVLTNDVVFKRCYDHIVSRFGHPQGEKTEQ